jgi:hypothetical protein
MTQLRKSSSNSWVQNVLGLVIVASIIAAPALLAAFFLHAGQQKKYPPELQELVDRYNQIEEEMTEEQADAIMVGYSSGTISEIREHDDQVFKRKSSYTKTFHKSGAEEGDFILQVFLDNDRYVVGKSIKGITR